MNCKEVIIMNKYWYKLMIVTLAAVMIVTTAKPAQALIPLPSFDIARIKGTIEKTLNQVMEIKNEIESNLHLVKTLQNEGSGAAAGMLFAKIESGDYRVWRNGAFPCGMLCRSAGLRHSDRPETP